MNPIPKPADWAHLPLFKKIGYYAKHLDATYSPYVDKLEAKRIVKEMAGDAIHVAPIIRVLNGPTDITQEDLNPAHIIKTTHGCGWNIDITPLTKIIDVLETLPKWNKVYAPGKELQYASITPRYFIEEKIVDYELGVTGKATVFSCRCIWGEPVSFHIKKNGKFNIYRSSDWSPIKIEMKQVSPPPEKLRMIELAKVLSKPFEFVRIDFYMDIHRKIYLSEFTFTPSGGHQFYPMEVEKEFGALW